MGYAFGTHEEMLFATGIVLFIFIKGIRFITPNFIFSDYLSEGGEMIEFDQSIKKSVKKISSLQIF